MRNRTPARVSSPRWRRQAKKQARRNLSWRSLFLLLIFLAGLVLFCYPFISNLIQDQYHSYVIDQYEQQVRDLSAEEKERLRQAAEAYNRSLDEGAGPILDPFAGQQESEPGMSNLDLLDLGPMIGHLIIPGIGLDLPIYHGTSERVLQKGIGHLERTALPVGGDSTHAVLTGHRGLPSAEMFRNLDQLAIGDRIYIHTLGDVYAYQVDEINIVQPDNVEKLRPVKGRDLLTLITCEPYMINSHRLLVRSTRIPYIPDTAGGTPDPAVPGQSATGSGSAAGLTPQTNDKQAETANGLSGLSQMLAHLRTERPIRFWLGWGLIALGTLSSLALGLYLLLTRRSRQSK